MARVKQQRKKKMVARQRRHPELRRGTLRALAVLGCVLAALAFTALIVSPAIVMNSFSGYMAILVVVFALLISLICMMVLTKSIRALSDLRDVSCVRGQDSGVGLKIRNSSLISCASAVADVYVSDLFGAEDGTRKTTVMLPAKSDVEFNFDVDMTHVGIYHLGIERMRLYDFTGLAHRTLPIEGRFTATVLPRIHTVDELRFSEDDAVPTTNRTRSVVQGGFDYTGVREYALGDPMKQIHWKLSAHTREYMTKIRESNQQQEYAIMCDFASQPFGSSDILMEINDALIETSLSLAREVQHNDLAHKLIYCDKDGFIKNAVVPSDNGMATLIADFSVINPNPRPDYPDGATMLVEEAKAQNRATNVLMVTSRPTPGLIQELQRVKAQGRSPELYIVVPAAYTSREVEDTVAPARALNDFGVSYFAVRTEPIIPDSVKGVN